MTVGWTAPTGTATGNSAITSYALYWDAGTTSPSFQLIDANVNQFTVQGLVAGANYIFKVRAKNIYGYGLFSPSPYVTFQASDVPDIMAAITTTIVGTQVKFAWTAPSSHNSPILSYDLRFITNSGTLVQYTTTCDATTDPVKANGYCLIEMLTL